MPISISRHVLYDLLKKIAETGQGLHEVDFSGNQLSEADLLAHLDYLNQNQYINADFTDSGRFQKAEITDKGRNMIDNFEEKLSKNPDSKSSAPIAEKDLPFLEKVMVKGGLADIFDARDITEVAFRVMRDLMTTEAADRVEAELHKPAEKSDDKSLQMEIAELWHDTNPIVGFLSRVRPPWQGPGIFKIDSDRFLFRVANEGGMPPNADREKVIMAIFSATKDELSQERIQEIASWLPDVVRKMWEEA
jgi:uncharacterized protein (DUF2267 family)